MTSPSIVVIQPVVDDLSPRPNDYRAIGERPFCLGFTWTSSEIFTELKTEDSERAEQFQRLYHFSTQQFVSGGAFLVHAWSFQPVTLRAWQASPALFRS